MDERDRTVAEIMIEMANGARHGMTQMPATCTLSDARNGNIHLLPPLKKASCDKRKREMEDISQDKHTDVPSKSRFRSMYQLLSAIRYALINQLDGEIEGRGVNGGYMTQRHLPTLTTHQIVELVRLNPGDKSILEMNELVLIEVIRQCLKVFSSTTAPPGAIDWKPLVAYEKDSRHWSWVGPAALVHLSPDDPAEQKISLRPWGIPQETRGKLASCVAAWLERTEETLRGIASLPPPPAILMQPIDMVERFRGIRHKRSTFRTISPSSEQVRAYFRMEEALRYSILDRAFPYTAADGSKSMVAPLWGFANAPNKARTHPSLKENRPPSFSILCLVRDAAARLPGGIGTKNDIFTLAKDSAFIAEEINDSIVTGALDRLKKERDPCVIYDKKTHLWLYLHRDREVEDFLQEARTSTEIVIQEE